MDTGQLSIRRTKGLKQWQIWDVYKRQPYVQNVRLVSKIITGMPIGYDIETKASIDEESVMITKDFNFVNTDFYLEYMVSDPVKYLYASQDPEATLKMLAQSYIRDTVGIYTVDDVITLSLIHI